MVCEMNRAANNDSEIFHAALTRILARVPEHTRRTLTPDQIIALSRATEQSDGVHLIDFRASTSVFYRPLYLRVLVGDERRSKERLVNEKQLGAVKTAFVVAMLGWVVTSVTLIILIVLVNFFRTALGIDVFDTPAFLRYCFLD